MLRVDVAYLRPNNFHEVGLVDYPPGGKAKTPTLFVGAYCSSKEDQKWFEGAVKEIVARSKLPRKRRPTRGR